MCSETAHSIVDSKAIRYNAAHLHQGTQVHTFCTGVDCVQARDCLCPLHLHLEGA